MTFYSVQIYSSNLAGEATDLDTSVKAQKLVEKYFKSGAVQNVKYCSPCQSRPFDGTGDANYHTFMIREHVALALIDGQDFRWTKKRGFGRKDPKDFLEGLISEKKECWFQIDISEI